MSLSLFTSYSSEEFCNNYILKVHYEVCNKVANLPSFEYVHGNQAKKGAGMGQSWVPFDEEYTIKKPLLVKEICFVRCGGCAISKGRIKNFCGNN